MKYLHTYYVTKRSWKAPLSFLVRLFQNSEYDHAGFGISEDGKTPLTIHEATLKGVIEVGREEFLEKHTDLISAFKIPLIDEELNAIKMVVNNNKGKKYAHMQLLGNAFAIILKKWFNVIIKKNVFGNGTKKLVCSEYLGTVLTVVGGMLPHGFDFESITVVDCLTMNKNINKAIRTK